jgi:hypothetical protein
LWEPDSFLVSLRDVNDEGKLFESGAISPDTAAINAARPTAASGWVTPAGKLLVLPAIASDGVGNRIYDANSFYTLLGGAGGGVTENYSLACDIDLRGYTDSNGDPVTSWAGPSGYGGHFYGNGYTITGLVLTEATGATGLFRSLGNNAVVENFTLEVSTSDDLKNNTPVGNVTFGGVVGGVGGAVTVTIKNVIVNGTIELFGVDTNTAFVIGGFIGSTGTTSLVNIDKCVSNMSVKVKSSAQANINTSGVGGFIGSLLGVTNISNSYSTGDIEFTSAVDSFFLAGCFAGVVGANVSGPQNWHVTITNSYASGNLVIDYKNRTAFNTSFSTNVGGFVGGVRRVGTIVVENCAYVGNKIVVLRSSSDGLIGMGRIYGGTSRSAGEIVDTAGSTFTNNIARLGITYGATTAAADQGTANNDVGTLSETAQNGTYGGGTTFGPGIDGYGVSSGALNQTSTWGTKTPDANGFAGLGWSQDIWDFSTVASLGRPVLKK